METQQLTLPAISQKASAVTFGGNFWFGNRREWPTTQELKKDLYLRRSYLTLFLNGTGYQESKLES
jgi:hypothetical protein